MRNTPLDRLQLSLARRRPAHPLARAGWWVARYAVALAGDLLAGEINLRAMSLVYTTLLSLVPLLALAFSLLKALGVHHGLDSVLRNFLAPLGPDASVLADKMVGFVDNVQVGVLGAVGVVFLFYSAIALIFKIEASFNYLWETTGTVRRLQRISEYIAVLVMGPLILFSALGVTASLRNPQVVGHILAAGPMGDALVWVSKLATYLLMVVVFIFIYSFIPNIRVRWRAALVGGVFAGVVWQSASAIFATFVAGTSNYNAIYSGFAILVFLLLWFYVGWLVVLLGCRLSFYVQFPQRLLPRKQNEGTRRHEVLTLAIFALVARRYIAGETPWTAGELVKQIGVGQLQFGEAFKALLDHGYLVESSSNGGIVPARDVDRLRVVEVWQCARGKPENSHDPADVLAEAFVARAEAAVDDGLTMRTWLEGAAIAPSAASTAEEAAGSESPVPRRENRLPGVS